MAIAISTINKVKEFALTPIIVDIRGVTGTCWPYKPRIDSLRDTESICNGQLGQKHLLNLFLVQGRLGI